MNDAAETRWDSVRAVLRARRNDPAFERADRAGDLPASYGQERLWLLDQLQPNGNAYNLAVSCRLEGPLDVPALERSLTELVRRHEILRTTLVRAAGALVQRIAPVSAVPLPIDDVDVHAGAGELEAWVAAHAGQPFDLARGPLFRARLARLGSRDHCLLLSHHHAIFDAWSFEIFMAELCALYAGGEAPSAGAARLAYADFAAWQRRQIGGGARDGQLGTWTRRLGGELPDLRLPTDRPRTRGPSGRAGSLALTISTARAEALRALARKEGATLYMVLLAAFQTLLHRYTGEEDVIVGTPVASRSRAELQAMMGLLTNTLALRTDLGGQPTFRQLLGRVRETVTEALAHQDLPFELVLKAVRAARPARAPGVPLFRVMFALQNVPRSSWSWPGLSAQVRNVPAAGAKVELALTMQEHPDGLSALVEFDADLFDAATIARLLSQLDTLLGAIAADPDRPIAALPLLEPAERRRLLTAWNDTAAPYPREATIHGLFEAEARRAPEATALIGGDDERVSYGELERRANRLARRLRALRLGPEAVVGVCLERSPDLIVALLAILKAGAAYLPIDRAAPPARAAQLLARAAAIVTDARGPSGTGVPVVRVDATLAGERDDALDAEGAPTWAAYVMFTSGSTGVPRAVGVPHRAVVRLVRGADYARFEAGEVFLQLAPAAFDAATFEIWGALLNGATLVLAPARPLSVSDLGALVGHHRVTTLLLTSGLFERVVDGGGLSRMGSLRQLLTGGDVMSPAHAARFLRERPGCRLLNAYGPTENTTLTTAHVVDGVEPGRAVPIGRPIANTRVYVLDGRLEPVPLGVVGEAYAAGDGLARGYLDDPDATRARFIASPFVDGETLYRTGDRVRQRVDGVLEFVGRTDDQVKIRGYRVEPGEVERALGEHPQVDRATVRAEGDVGDRRLVAHVVPRRPDATSAAELRAYLRARLPGYMVPAEIALVPELPLTGNGKRDRRAEADAGTSTPTAAPRDALEQRLSALVAAVLRRGEIGIHDDLPDAGLDSLSALELAVAIERETGRPFALATLFERPTVAELAAALRAAAPATAPLGAGVMRIRDGLGPRPLFLIASGRGGEVEATIYARLAARLPPDAPVLALLAPPAGDTAPEIAARYVATIRRLQPRGPYRLGGQCIGGVAAHEAARQLRATGEEVELLLLIDSWCPSTAGSLHHALVGRPRALLKAGLAFLAGLPARASAGEPWPLELWRRAVPPRASRRHMRALMRHRPRRYEGEVTLIASAESLRLGIAEAWRPLAAGALVVHAAPGDHESYFKQHFQETAEVLRLCIEAHARRRRAAS